MEAADQLNQLNHFVGKWKTTGLIPSTHTSPEVRVHGTDTYEWLPGKFFLLHKADVTLGTERNQTLEIIGMSKEPGKFFMHYYDNKGENGHMLASVSNNEWAFVNDKLRFSGSFKNNHQEFSGVWEQQNGTTWTKFMEIKLVKFEP